MGFNTAALILNDALGSISSDGEIGHRIHSAVVTAQRLGGNVSASGLGGTHIGAIRVLPSEHADYVQIVAVGGNTIRRLGGSMRYEPEDLLRDLANQMGFTLRRKPNRP